MVLKLINDINNNMCTVYQNIYMNYIRIEHNTVSVTGSKVLVVYQLSISNWKKGKNWQGHCPRCYLKWHARGSFVKVIWWVAPSAESSGATFVRILNKAAVLQKVPSPSQLRLPSSNHGVVKFLPNFSAHGKTVTTEKSSAWITDMQSPRWKG